MQKLCKPMPLVTARPLLNTKAYYIYIQIHSVR